MADKTYNFLIDVEYNTAINKKLFSNLLAKRVSNLGIEVKFDSRIGKLSFYDRINDEKEEKLFSNYIAGDSRFDINYESNNCDYKLKEGAFPEGEIREKLKRNMIFKLRLSDYTSILEGRENDMRIDFVDLFDINLNRNFNKIQKHSDLSRNNNRAKDNSNFKEIYTKYIKFNPSPDKNCFDLFDILSKYMHICLYVYYRKTDYHENDYDGLVNGTYENYLKLIPVLKVVDEDKGEVLYEGDSVLDLSLKYLDILKSQLDILDINNILSKINNVGKVFKSLMIIQHLFRQLAKLKEYLTIRELSSELDIVKSQVNKLFEIIKERFDQIYYKVVALDILVDNKNMLYEMESYYYDLYEKRGYFTIDDINAALIQFNF